MVFGIQSLQGCVLCFFDGFWGFLTILFLNAKHLKIMEGIKCGQTGLYGFRLGWSSENSNNKKQGNLVENPVALCHLGALHPSSSLYPLYLISFKVLSSPSSASWCRLYKQLSTTDKIPLWWSNRDVAFSCLCSALDPKIPWAHCKSGIFPVTCFIAG